LNSQVILNIVKKMGKYAVKWFVMGIVIYGMQILFCVTCLKVEAPDSNRAIESVSFDSEALIQSDDFVRGTMIEHLVSAQDSLFSGKTKSQIVEILGKPAGDSHHEMMFYVDVGLRVKIFNKPWHVKLFIEFDKETQVFKRAYEEGW